MNKIINTEKLTLTAEEKEIFKKALQDSYDAGKDDAIFVFSSTSALVVGPVESIKKVFNKYCISEK